jgi:hypothetical protein
LRVQATNSPSSFEVTTTGTGVVGPAGAALLRELADRLGQVVSTPTAWRVLERAARTPMGWPGCGPPRHTPAPVRGRLAPHPDPELLIVDADATLVLAHSDAKEGAAGTYKGSFGFAPLLAYLDRGQTPGEPLAGILRPGNAPLGATDDLVELVDLALHSSPLPTCRCWCEAIAPGPAPGWPGTCASAAWGSPWACRQTSTSARRSPRSPGSLDARGRRRRQAPSQRRGLRADRLGRPGQLAGGHPPAVPPGGRPPRCAARFTDLDGHRFQVFVFQVFVTDQGDGDLAALELRHRQRARVEDRIRAAKATGLRNLPVDRWRRNQVWLELVLTAQDLVCWAQALLLDGPLAVAEPKTLRYRLWHQAARIVRHARRTILRLQRSWPWASELAAAFARLRALPLHC